MAKELRDIAPLRHLLIMPLAVVAVITIGLAGCRNSSQSDSEAQRQPSPTRYVRHLTEAEVAPLFEGEWQSFTSARQGEFSTRVVEDTLTSFEEGGLNFLEIEGCEVQDFNEFKRAWVLTCTEVYVTLAPRPGEFPNVARNEFARFEGTYLMYDETLEMTDIDGDPVPYGR